MSFDLLGNEQQAIQSYEAVASLLNENATTSRYIVEWSEDSLYRAVLMGLRQG